MPIAVVCPSCKTKMKAPDASAGRNVRCPRCNATFQVAAVPADSFQIPASTPPIAAMYSPAQEATALQEAKSCPFCGEKVLAAAKKCKHCGETIDVALRAAEEARREAVEARRAA